MFYCITFGFTTLMYGVCPKRTSERECRVPTVSKAYKRTDNYHMETVTVCAPQNI